MVRQEERARRSEDSLLPHHQSLQGCHQGRTIINLQFIRTNRSVIVLGLFLVKKQICCCLQVCLRAIWQFFLFFLKSWIEVPNFVYSSSLNFPRLKRFELAVNFSAAATCTLQNRMEQFWASKETEALFLSVFWCIFEGQIKVYPTVPGKIFTNILIRITLGLDNS